MSEKIPFHGFATDITAEIANTDGWNLADVERMVAEHLYQFAVHILMHTTPVAGSPIKKYQGMTLDEIVQAIPDGEKPS
jgi:hypothetical protein